MIIRNILTYDWQCATGTVILEYFISRCKSRKNHADPPFSVLRYTSTLYVRYCRKQDTDNCGLTGTRFRRRNEDYLQ